MIRLVLSTLIVSLFMTISPVEADTKGSMFSREIRREAQEALNFYGFDTGVPDGIFGTQTQIAIRNFQTSKGGQITGEFSRATMGLLLQSYRTDRDKIRPTLVASGRPQAVENAISEIANMCGTSTAAMASKPGFLQEADLNKDGVKDFLLDGSASGCMEACGASSCEVTVVASDGKGGYRYNDFLGYSITQKTFVCATDGSCRFAK